MTEGIEHGDGSYVVADELRPPSAPPSAPPCAPRSSGSERS